MSVAEASSRNTVPTSIYTAERIRAMSVQDGDITPEAQAVMAAVVLAPAPVPVPVQEAAEPVAVKRIPTQRKIRQIVECRTPRQHPECINPFPPV